MNSLQVTVIGGGLIGASWTALFLAHGHRVCVHDVAPDVERRVRQELDRIRPQLRALGLSLPAWPPGLSFEPDLARAVEKAEVVQECGPERLAFKQRLWAQVESFCPPRALLLSSSSGLTASMQSRHMQTPERMLVGHPFNPPHLLPLVEVVPGKRTGAKATERARAFYESLGKRPIVLRKEIPGFVANRLQAAVIRESVSLVRAGVVSVQDLDEAMMHSLGQRWAIAGPFESAHLGGGPGGIRAFFAQFSGGLQLLWLHMRLKPVLLTRKTRQALSDDVETQWDTGTLDARASRRDQRQLALLRALQDAGESFHER